MNLKDISKFGFFTSERDFTGTVVLELLEKEE